MENLQEIPAEVEIDEEFQCCVCWGVLFKPVVLEEDKRLEWFSAQLDKRVYKYNCEFTVARAGGGVAWWRCAVWCRTKRREKKKKKTEEQGERITTHLFVFLDVNNIKSGGRRASKEHDFIAEMTVFTEPIYVLLRTIQRKPFFCWPEGNLGTDNGGQNRDPKKQCLYHDEFGHYSTTCQPYKTFLEQLVAQDQWIDRAKTLYRNPNYGGQINLNLNDRMYPIIGERYRCKDCKEKIGFDLREGCYYNSSSKLPGRFSQQHTPEHKLENVQLHLEANDVSRLETDVMNLILQVI
ncbi:hypothetical protein RHMOL_Rhmol09G0067000 [Rhododendron molle]|uniref:Uncharacterized protein n=1 Tax=Rhododendron molle TaxID=49168 RepID=A0ACC0MB86_RHOML|nr:hypothetical protein RHMOL_Rhmol09G0067000 [Rhododendron molle]